MHTKSAESSITVVGVCAQRLAHQCRAPVRIALALVSSSKFPRLRMLLLT